MLCPLNSNSNRNTLKTKFLYLAIFANMLDAQNLTIWKDVEGVMNADPKQFPDAQFLSELNYDEVIEMAYYGAQVIHPKTIKPLQNKDIPSKGSGGLPIRAITIRFSPGKGGTPRAAKSTI